LHRKVAFRTRAIKRKDIDHPRSQRALLVSKPPNPNNSRWIEDNPPLREKGIPTRDIARKIGGLRDTVFRYLAREPQA